MNGCISVSFDMKKRKFDQSLVDNIVHLVAEFYEVQQDAMLYGNRERKYSEPRHVAMYCLYQIAMMPYPAITELFGKKSHRTTMYAVEKVREWKYNPKLNKKAADCIQYVVQNKTVA
jgi:chromosomal replication initiation ATPase DnaA